MKISGNDKYAGAIGHYLKGTVLSVSNPQLSVRASQKSATLHSNSKNGLDFYKTTSYAGLASILPANQSRR